MGFKVYKTRGKSWVPQFQFFELLDDIAAIDDWGI